jgi:hypothetical protein
MPEVEVPSRCLHFKEGMDNCRVVKNGWGCRDTGPSHPLRRVKCHHGPGYRLYPPGYSPYQRAAVAPVDATGEIVFLGGDGASKDPGLLAWRRTFFAAALDAAMGIGWSRESPADDPRRRRTQRRYLALCATLMGLCPQMDDAVSQRIASVLGIAWLSLSDRRAEYQSVATYMEQGAVIKEILEMILLDRSLSHRLLTAGFIAGLWGRPQRWDPG